MKKISIAFLAAVSLASFGCKKKGGGADTVAKMSEFRDRMCACKDKACADKVNDDITKWTQEQAKSGDIKTSEDDTKKMMAVSEEMSKCMQKFVSDTAAGGAGGAAGGGAAGGGAAAGSDTGAAGGAAGGAAAGSDTGAAGSAPAPAGGSAEGSAGSAK